MKKTFSLGTVIAIVLISVILTFQITYVAVAGIYADHYSTNGTSNAETDSDFMTNVIERLSALDTKFRNLYIGELDDEVLIDYILKGYVAGTGDKFGAYYTDNEFDSFMSDLSGETEGIGVSVIYNTDYQCIEIINVMSDSPALEAGLQAGDLIVYIGEEKESVASLGYNAALAKLRGAAGTEAVFSVIRNEDTSNILEFSITRAKVEEINVFSHVCELDSTVGIIKLTAFDYKTPDQFKGAMESLASEGCDKFIIDVRYNPGGELQSVVSILDYLLPEGPIIRIFDADDNLVKQYSSDAECVDYPIAVVTNSSTASAAELFTSALRDYDKAIVVGNTTYGKGCMQTTVELPDGGALSVTYRMYKPPFSEGYHEIGITPDIVLDLDEALAGKNVYKITDEEDNQLRAALDALTK